jgi:hypothetical protein
MDDRSIHLLAAIELGLRDVGVGIPCFDNAYHLSTMPYWNIIVASPVSDMYRHFRRI